MKESAGTLLYRMASGELEVLLIHSSGAYNKNKPWSIPKGEPDDDEPFEAAARRETLEETGVKAGTLASLGSIVQKGRKRVIAFAGPAPADAAPECASWEIDRAEFMPIAAARARIHPDQLPFLDRLEELLAESGDDAPGV
jgi:predicted NUDIX family NTP pyrophosphohydrolase